MAVLCRNQRLFRCVFWSHRCLRSAVLLNCGAHTRFVGLLDIHASTKHICISSALNRRSVIWRFKHSNVIKIHDGITFDFYMGLPHMYLLSQITSNFHEGKYFIVGGKSIKGQLLSAWNSDLFMHVFSCILLSQLHEPLTGMVRIRMLVSTSKWGA